MQYTPNFNPNIPRHSLGYRQPSNINITKGQPAGQVVQKQINQGAGGSYDALAQAIAAAQSSNRSQRFRREADWNFRQRDKPVAGAVMGGINEYLANRSETKAADSLKEQARIQEQAKLAKQDQLFEAAVQMAKANNATDAQAIAFGKAIVSGMDVDPDIFKPDKGTTGMQDRAARIEYIRNHPELIERHGQEKIDEFIMTGKINDGGLMMTFGEGGVLQSLTQGGGRPNLPLTLGNVTKQQEKLLNAEQTIETLNYISSIAKPEFLTYEGWGKATLGKVMDRSGASDSDLAGFNAERSAMMNRVLEGVMKYRKEITGVAGGPAEMKKIEAIRANPRMGPAEFKRAIEEQVRSAQRDANKVRRETPGMEEIDWPEYVFEWGAGPTTDQVSGPTNPGTVSAGGVTTQVDASGNRVWTRE
jgi:hypothetical protein